MPSWKKIITSGSSPNFSQITVDNTVTANAFSGTFQGALSSSAQIKTQISGAFTSTSSSLASRLTTREAFTTQSFSDGTATIISGSASSTGSFGHIIKGGVNWDTAVSSSAAAAGFGVGGGSSFTAAGISGSLGSNASIIRGLTNARISGSFTSTSSSLASRVTTAESELGNTLISGSGQIATAISGAFGNQRVGTTDNVVFNKITTTGPDVFGGNVTVTGNLTLQGSQSAAETLVIADQFGFFASGSDESPVDAGLLVQSGSAAMTGSALYHDITTHSTKNSKGGRWAVAKDVKADDTAATPKAFVTTVVTATDANDPDSTDVHYGVGEMYVNSDGEIWIYTGS